VFVARGFENLFPANTAGNTMLAAILPGFRLGLTRFEGGQNTVQIDPIGKAPLDDWRRVFWGWNKEFQFKVGVLCVEEAGLPVVSKLPYFTGEVTEANVDGSTSDTAAPFGSGVVNVLELWLREGEQLSVGTVYRTLDRRYTLDGISGSLNSFGDITLDKLIDAVRANGSAREYLFPAVFGPGSLNFSYSRTIHRVNLPIGQGFDVSSLAAVNAVLAPTLPDGATNLLVNLDGPSASDTSTDVGAITGGGGQGWMWDYVGKRWHPTKPGVFNLTWPDVAGYTNTIEVSAGFPGDTLTRSGFIGFENTNGTRQGSATNRYLATVTFPGVPTNYPGAPFAHYVYNIPPDGAPPAPADLDPKAEDNWFFKEFSYAERNSATVNNTKIFTDTSVSNRSVFVWTRRTNATQVANGDLSRESVTVRVGKSQATTNFASAVVAARLESMDDCAGFHSGRITPGSQNFNPLIYNTNTTAAVGQWGPIYPVNYSAGSNGWQNLSVDWYYNTATCIPVSSEEPPAYKPRITTVYTSLTWPDANSTATPVIYLSSQMGSEGVGQDVATNGIPNYQDIFYPSNHANLAVYNQPDRNATGYNPNEEHAFIAPSKAYVLTGDPRFNPGQGAAFALQNGLNNTNLTSGVYTSDPFVLVQYSVPGATNASDAFAMRAYAVKTVRTNAAAQPFPALDRQTHTAFDASGQPVVQPANPRYDFNYTAIAGNPVIPPYPLNLAIGNAILTNTIGGNFARVSLFITNGVTFYTTNGQRALWLDKNQNAWVVSGGTDARFFQRYFYPFRAGFWLENEAGQAAAAGTPVAWAPPAATNAVNATGLYTGAGAMPVAAKYQAYWGNNYPVLKKGETLTYAGGEYKADHPASPGLPAVLNMASAEVVYDDRTPAMILVTTNASRTEWAYRNGVRYLERQDTFNNWFDWSYLAGSKWADPGDVNLATSLSLTNLPVRNGINGDGGGRNKRYDLEAELWVDTGGSYTFYVTSGSGAILTVDGTNVSPTPTATFSSFPRSSDTNGFYGYSPEGGGGPYYYRAFETNTLAVTLAANQYHRIQITYVDELFSFSAREAIAKPKLVVEYEGPGIARQEIPANKLFLNPDDPLLPDNIRKNFQTIQTFTASSARVTRPLDRYAVSISREAMPKELQPANTANVLVSGSRWYFKQLPASLGQRFYYD
ncbi:MAG: hypothetical protein RJA22_3367, partial [Verrucomicrobiota bacterium]